MFFDVIEKKMSIVELKKILKIFCKERDRLFVEPKQTGSSFRFCSHINVNCSIEFYKRLLHSYLNN